MKVEPAEAQWLCEQAEISVEQLAELTGLSPEALRKLVDYGALVPVRAPAPVAEHEMTGTADSPPDPSAQWSFAADCVVAVRTARRLRDDFDLDPNALAVALMLIERIHGLEAQLRELHSRFPRTRGTSKS
jgi:chaperone modulatory protein CbpM